MATSAKERYNKWYNTPLTHERLISLIHYNPISGFFKNVKGRKGAYNKPNIGIIRKDGYQEITIDYKHFLAHRLAFFYMTKSWPEQTVDHINKNKSDNKWENLRLASYSENNQYSKKPSNNTSGFKGVSKRNGSYRATIRKDGKQEHIGVYNSPELAYEAYRARAKELFDIFYYED
jgi:hypothetical protein